MTRRKKNPEIERWSRLQSDFFCKTLKKKNRRVKSQRVNEDTETQDESRKCFLIGSESAGHASIFWIPRELADLVVFA